MGIILLFLSQSGRGLDSDVSTGTIVSTIAWVGFVSGSIFGTLLSLTENGKAILDISLRRAALWGMLSGAVFPLLTGRGNQVFWTCPFGALAAIIVLAIARASERRGSTRLRRLSDIFCTGVRVSVRCAVRPIKKPVRR
jgi:hypothetical protein